MKNSVREKIALTINGRGYEVGGKQAFMMLADFLRYELNLTGTKIVCAEGDCGACTVLVRRQNVEHFLPINSCIAMVLQLDGCDVITVEGLSKDGQLSPVQRALVDHHASQCGFCTPGFVMAITGMFEKPRSSLGEQKVKNCLTGNLCRCTGYQPIINAALSVDTSTMTNLGERYRSADNDDFLHTALQQSVYISFEDREYFAPLNLEDAVSLRREKPHLRVMSGATDLGVMINKNKIPRGSLLSLHLIAGLDELIDDGTRIIVGARVTLHELRHFIKNRVEVFSRFLNLFASPQIKNMATLVGNVANGSPIADTLPFLMVADGAVHTICNDVTRIIPITELYEGYKKLALAPDEIITHISFSKPRATAQLRLEKVSTRKDLDISCVNLAFYFDVDDTYHLHDARIAVGGVGPSVLRLKNIESVLTAKKLSRALIDHASSMISNEIAPIDDLRGSAQYRLVLVDELFRRYCYGVMANE